MNQRSRSHQSVIREIACLILIASLPAALAGWFHPQRPTWSWVRPAVTELSLAEINRRTTPILWVDARTAAAYQQRHIPGAVLCNEDTWEALLPGLLTAWQPGDTIIVYCDAQTCDASQAVALRLSRELGLTDIYVLKGGWATWQQAHP